MPSELLLIRAICTAASVPPDMHTPSAARQALDLLDDATLRRVVLGVIDSADARIDHSGPIVGEYHGSPNKNPARRDSTLMWPECVEYAPTLLLGFSMEQTPTPLPIPRNLSSSLLSHEKSRASPPMTTSAHHTAAIDGVKLINQYELIATLGKGTSGKVKLAYDTDRHTTVAIKIVKRGRTTFEKQKLQREIAVMKRLRHKNLVSLFEVIDDPHSEKLYLVMQYIDDGPLLTVDPDTLTCTPLDANAAVDVARQLCAGLAYLHSHHIVHRDIKPENILKGRDGKVFMCDFGLSEDHNELERVFGWKGSPQFMAPEVHALLGSNDLTSIDGCAADVYSLGVTFHLMLTGKMPQTSGDVTLLELEGLAEGWCQLLPSMLSPRPEDRPRVGTVRRAVKSIAAVFPQIPTQPPPNVPRRRGPPRGASDDPTLHAMLPVALRDAVEFDAGGSGDATSGGGRTWGGSFSRAPVIAPTPPVLPRPTTHGATPVVVRRLRRSSNAQVPSP